MTSTLDESRDTPQDTPRDTPRGSDYAGLSRAVRSARLLDRRRAHYSARIVITGLAFAAVWAVFLLVGDSWWQLVVAAVLGIAATQVAFLGHDGGHQQIARKRISNDVVGLVAGDLLNGLSIGWWVDKHNRHHSNPNKEQHDPDIGEAVFAFTTGAAARRTGRVGRAVGGYQAWLFFPTLMLEGIHLHIASIVFLAGKRRGRLQRVELLLLTVHLIAYFSLVLLVLSPGKALAFVAIHQAVFGLYMGCSFAPNHKGMQILGPHEAMDFLRKQVVTSRNVRGGWFVDQLLGGLNYQIEHHLFPNMPRPSLRKAQSLVRSYCHEHAIPYCETTLLQSYVMAIRHLHEVGRPLRSAPGLEKV
jgi:fatty acid desaturase